MSSERSGGGQAKKRRRPLTGGSSPRKSLPMMDLKTAISSAKEKFEADIAVGFENEEIINNGRKTSSAPASPGKALSVVLPAYESKRPRLSPRNLRKSSLLIPATEVVAREATIKQEEAADDQNKHQKRGNKGVSMSEVIKLHQI